MAMPRFLLGKSVGQAKLISMSKGRNWPLTKDTFQHFAGRSCHRGAREHVMLVVEVGSASERPSCRGKRGISYSKSLLHTKCQDIVYAVFVIVFIAVGSCLGYVRSASSSVRLVV